MDIVPIKERRTNSGMDVFTRISLCSGYDGLGLGLKRAIPNVRTVCYVERETYAVASLVAKIKEGKLDDAPVWDDIATFDGRPFEGLVNIIDAGVPCQPWSVAGKRKGAKDDRWIWDDIFRIIIEVQPNYVFLEEVPGFVSGGGLGFVLSDLTKAGFDAEWSCFTAAEVGAPHKRQRLFIMAQSGECNGEWWPAQLRRRIGEPGQIGESGRISQLANTARTDTECERQFGDDLSLQGSETMADTGSAELPRRQSQPGNNEQELQAITGSCDKWPARPGQPQYEWEEPRVVVANSNRSRNAQSGLQRTGISSESGAVADAIRDVGKSRAGTRRISNGGNEVWQGQAESCVGE